jgi:outer membrane protein TolC
MYKMKQTHVHTLVLVFMLFLCYSSKAQTALNDNRLTDSVWLNENKELAEQLLPLDSIITIALIHSPQVRFQTDLIDESRYQVDFIKKLWTNNIVGFVNYSAGDQNLVSANGAIPGTTSVSNITNGYRVGIQVNIPLYEIVGRQSRVNIYKAQLNENIDKRDQIKIELSQLVIQNYYSLIYYHNLIQIRSDAKESTINQYSIAQQEFKDGIIDAAELARLKTIEVNSRADYEEAKREFSILYFQLQKLTGASIQQLMQKK